MRAHIFPVACTVCGGDGVGTISTAGAAWDSRNEIVHVDPRVCRDNLARRAAELAKQAEENKNG